jgi:hypothetical protein
MRLRWSRTAESARLTLGRGWLGAGGWGWGRWQLEAEEKMRLGVEEYKQKLATELDTVSRQLASERKKQQALEVYRDKVASESGGGNEERRGRG